MKQNLTPAVVAKLIEAGTSQDTIHYDLKIPQFGLRLRPQGGASWVLRFSQNGVERRHRIDSARTLEVAEAREKALDLLKQIGRGVNPNAERRATRDRSTFSQVWDLHVESPHFQALSADSQATRRAHGKRFVAEFGTVPIDAFTADHARPFLRELMAQKKVRRKGLRGTRLRGGLGAARKSARELSAFFTWAAREGYCKGNPVKGVIKAGGDNRREVEPLTPEQYKAMFDAIAAAEASGTMTPAAADVVRMLALTGCRRNEIRDLTWAQVDVKGGRLVFAPKQHKAGKRTQRAKVVELAPAAVAILERQQILEGGDRVFAGRSGKRIEVNRVFRGIVKAAKLPATITPHALRHSLGGIAAMNRMTVPEIMRLLGHSTPSQAMRYVTWAQENTGVATRVIDAALGVANE